MLRKFLAGYLAAALLLPVCAFAEETTQPPLEVKRPSLKIQFSGYAKSQSFFTQTSGFSPEFVDNPALLEQDENSFNALQRLRLKIKALYKISDETRVSANIHYDHQANFGTFISTGDARISRKQAEDRQFLDLSQTLIENDDTDYQHRLYRASVLLETRYADVEIGRQQIPWGVGHFFTPTDVFNSFNPTQIELEERDGVDALRLRSPAIRGVQGEFIYTPQGRQLHPSRFMGRLSGDFRGYEIGILGGHIKRDNAVGFDFAGNIGDSSVRGELLFRNADTEKDYLKFTVNADYNFPFNLYGLIEYHFNGQGRRDTASYQLDRLVRGDIRELGRNYGAVMLGYDVTALIRLENRLIMNLDDASLFLRPEVQYELSSDLLFTLASQLFLGSNTDEYGRPKNLFFGELTYSF